MTDNIFKVFVGWAWDKLYNRKWVLENDLWFQEQRTSNDMLFVFSAVAIAKRIAYVEKDKILAHQRRNNKSSLSNTREKSWDCFYNALSALRDRLKTEGIYEEVERDYINYALHFALWNLNTLAEPTHQKLFDKLKTNGGKTWVLKAKKAITFTTKKNLSSTKNCLNKCCFKNTGIKSAGGITARILFFSFTHRTEDNMFL